MITSTARQSRRWAGVSVLGLCHGLGDFNAGILLAIVGNRTGADLVLMYLLYNVLAFVGQPFAGLICDRLGYAHRWFYGSGLLSVASLLLVRHQPEVAIICSGVASAFYHSAGGALAWDLGGKRVLATGLFTAPGVIGIALGLSWGARLNPQTVLLVAAGLVLGLLILTCLLHGVIHQKPHDQRSFKTGLSLIGSAFSWLILLAIGARSFAWSLGQQEIFPPYYAVNLALAAAIGKVIASAIADRAGAGLVSVGSLALAAVLLFFGDKSPEWFFPAVTALQAGTGPMMAMVLRAWPNLPAFGSGLSQGLAVAMGGAPILILSGMGSTPIYIATGALIFAATIMVIVIQSERKRRLELPNCS